MRTVKTIFKFAFVVLLVLVAALVIVINYAAYASTYECSGLVGKPGTVPPTVTTTLYMKITHYRWWGFWTDSDGMMHSEIPSTSPSGISNTGLFLALRKGGDYFQIYRDNVKELPQGQFSTIRNFLMLNITDETVFKGSCSLKAS